MEALSLRQVTMVAALLEKAPWLSNAQLERRLGRGQSRAQMMGAITSERWEHAATEQVLPIHVAAEMQRVDLVQLLVEFGAQIDTVSHVDGDTPLLASLRNPGPNPCEAFKCLLALGADPLLVNAKHQSSCLHYAARWAFDDVIRAVFAASSSESSSSSSSSTDSTIETTAESTSESTSESSSEPTTESTEPTTESTEPTTETTERNVRKLVDLPNDDLVSPFLMAARHRHLPTMRLLCSLGNVDVNRQDLAGNSAMHVASMDPHAGGSGREVDGLTVYDVLVATLGVNPLLVNEAGDTALHVAVAHRNVEAVLALLNSFGGRECVHKVNKVGLTPMHEFSWGHERWRSSPGFMTSFQAEYSIARALIDAGADVNMAQPDNGYTALHAIACSPILAPLPLISIVIGSPLADLNVRCAADDTPLMLFAMNGHVRAVHLLCNAGVDRSLRNNIGLSVRDIAVHAAIIRFLDELDARLEHDADGSEAKASCSVQDQDDDAEPAATPLERPKLHTSDSLGDLAAAIPFLLPDGGGGDDQDVFMDFLAHAE
jgi:ankyrin repeat protein